MFQTMTYAIVVLKNIFYGPKFLFLKVQKGQLMKDTISTRVSTELEEIKNPQQLVRIKFEKFKFKFMVP